MTMGDVSLHQVLVILRSELGAVHGSSLVFSALMII